MDYGDRILNSARDLFFKYGLRSVTMDDISRELGISKKTLYARFQNKNAIVNIITTKFLEHHEKEYELLLSKSKDAVDELLILMEDLNYVFERLNPRMIFDMQRFFPEAWQIFEEHKNKFMVKKIVNNLKKGIQEGLFRQDINVKIIAQMRLNQIQLALDPAIFPAEVFEIKEVHRQLLLQYLHGITSLKGHKMINKYFKIEDEDK